MAVSLLATRLLTPNLATYTHSAVTFGAEAADRYIAVATSAVAGALQSVSSITIGGIDASIAASVDVNGSLGLAIAIAEVPEGEAGDIVVNYSGQVNANHIAVWRITGIDSATAHDFVTATGAAASDMSGTLDVVAGGVLIAAEAFFGSSRQRASGGSAAPGSTASDFAVSVDNTGATAAWTGVALEYTDQLEGTSSVSQAFAAVSWAPSSAGGVTGTLAANEVGSDTAEIAGSVLISGSMSGAEAGPDTAAITGSVPISGTLDADEIGTDVAVFTGSVGSEGVVGSMSAAEAGHDSASFGGGVLVSGALAAQEAANDNFAAAGGVLVSGTMAATEVGADTFLGYNPAAVRKRTSRSGMISALPARSPNTQDATRNGNQSHYARRRAAG